MGCCHRRVRIETAEAGRPGFDDWVGRWYDGWCDAVEAGLSAGRDDPVYRTRDERLASLRTPMASVRRHLLAAVHGDAVVGAARVELPMTDNLTLAGVDVIVPPHVRGRGHGTALLQAARDLAEEGGRKSLLAELDRPAASGADDWPGSSFARRHGFTMRLESIRRDLPLPLDPEHADRLRHEARPHARGYRIECFAGHVAAQDRDRMAALKARMTTDAPLGELDYETERWDAARVLEQEDEAEAMGMTWWTAVALAPDGAWAGFTQLAGSAPEPRRLHQWDTLVLREHRGHRLGLLLKLEALDRAVRERPQARVVTTWNAASNTPMIAINEAIGYTAVEITEEWQADLDGLRLP